MTARNITHATFTLERRYDSPPGRVFAAWGDPAAKGRWFANGASGYQLDFRVGGLDKNAGEHEGTVLTWESLYREIVQDERIVYTSVLFEGPTVATVSQATVEFIAKDGGTTVVLTEQGAYLDGRELPEWRENGTAEQLAALGRHLQTAEDA